MVAPYCSFPLPGRPENKKRLTIMRGFVSCIHLLFEKYCPEYDRGVQSGLTTAARSNLQRHAG